MPMVSSKLGIGTVEGGVAVGLGLLDPIECVPVSLDSFQGNSPIVMRVSEPSRTVEKKGNRTRSGGLFCFDYAARSS